MADKVGKPLFQDRSNKTVEPGLQWWKQPKGQAGAAMIAGVNSLQQTTLGLQTRLLRAARLFGGYGYMSGGRFATSTVAGGPLGQGARAGPRDNIVYSVITTAASQLLDDGAPSVSFLTNHGDYELQEKAQKLEEFTDGLFYQVGFDMESVQVLMDALIFGTGFMKYFVDGDNTIHNERVFPSEIFVDIWDGRDRRPRTIYQVGFVDRDVLASRYPSKKKTILDCKPMMPVGYAPISPTSATNIIPFIEAWHLPSSTEAGDGRHCLALSNDLWIEDEKWEDDDFPFSVLRFELLPTGYHGMGVAELLQGDQLSLNDANRAEYWAWSQVATPRIFMQSGTLDRNHLNSSMSGIILEGSGPPPQVLNWQGVHPQFVEWKQDIKAQAFARIGISPQAASGMKPPGLNSGEAQKVYKDTQHSRFSILSQRWQELRVDAAKKNIALARRVYTKEGAFAVKVLGKNFLKEIDFGEVDLPEEEYRLKVLPVSQLPKSVAGRIDTTVEMLQSNLIDQDMGRKLLKLPDIDEAMSLQNAAYDNARRTAYIMFHEGKAMRPDPVQNLQLCQKIVTAELLRGIDNDMPKERQDLGRNFLVQLKAMLAPPPPTTGEGAPIAQGAAPPTSPLVPFKPPPGAPPPPPPG